MIKQLNKQDILNSNIEKLNTTLLESINCFKEQSKRYVTSMPTNNIGEDIIIEDEPGKIIKFEKSVYHQMLYTDINKLKRDTTTLIDEYVKEMKPIIKNLNDVLPRFTERFDNIEEDIETIKNKQPKTFSKWLDDKAHVMSSGGTILKTAFWIVVLLYFASVALPNLFKFISSNPLIAQ